MTMADRQDGLVDVIPEILEPRQVSMLHSCFQK